MKYKLVYKGNSSTHVFKRAWLPGSEYDVESILATFKKEYCKSTSLPLELISYDSAFLNWFVENKLSNFNHLFELVAEKPKKSKYVGTTKVTAELEINNTKSGAEANLKNKVKEKGRTVTKASDTVIKGDDSTLKDPLTKSKEKMQSSKQKVLTGDQMDKVVNNIQDATTSKVQAKTTGAKGVKTKNGKQVVVSLETADSNKAEALANAKSNKNVHVFDPTLEEVSGSKAKVIKDTGKGDVNISMSVSSDEEASVDSDTTVLTPNSVQNKSRGKTDAQQKVEKIVNTSDLKEVKKYVKNIIDKGVLIDAKRVAKNNGNHEVVKIIDDRMRTI